MRFFVALALYRMLLPLLLAAAFPGWLIKMLKRGGFGTRLGERAAVYTTPLEQEPCGAVHVHAVSVGETMLALKLIRAWLEREPGRRFVLATGTATGHAVATAAWRSAGSPLTPFQLRVTYAPLDLPSMVGRYCRRFEPSQVVLVEGEAWPHLLLACRRRGVPVSLVNARMSPRSARRYRRFAKWIRPLFGQFHAVAIQDPEAAETWQQLGVAKEKIFLTGSLKIDPGSGPEPARRAAFQRMLDAFGPGRPVILVASTHAGEEAWIAAAIRAAGPELLPVIVPRHAERRAEVKRALEQQGFAVALRSEVAASGALPAAGDGVFVVDSTGELRDWTAHADVVVIGKSFLAEGGQNPCEAIQAEKPVVFGPHMENFEPLVGQLLAAGACTRVGNQEELSRALRGLVERGGSPESVRAAKRILARHEGATDRIVSLLIGTAGGARGTAEG